MAVTKEQRAKVEKGITHSINSLNEAKELVHKIDYSHIDVYEKVHDAYEELRELLNTLEDIREAGRSK